MGLIFRARAELVSWIKVRTRKLSEPKDDDKIGIFCAEKRKALKRDFPCKIKWGGRESNFYSPSGARSLILRFPNGLPSGRHIFRGVEPGRGNGGGIFVGIIRKMWNIVRWWLPAPDFNTIRFSRVRWGSREKRTVCSDSAIQYSVSESDLSGACLFVFVVVWLI